MSQNHIIQILDYSKGSLYYNKKGYPKGRKSTKQEDPVAKEIVLKICSAKGTYGVPRVKAIAKREYNMPMSYYKVYRLMGENDLLIKRSKYPYRSRLHTGRIAVAESNLRWCSDITGIKFWNRTKARFSYILDCCDRNILSYRFQEHIQACDIEQMMQEALLKRFGGKIPNGHGIEFLHDNGPEYIENILRKNLKAWNVIDCNTPTYSPQSNGMSESFNGTFKRDYVYQFALENYETVKAEMPKWIEEYNTYAPHSALGMLTPDEFFKLKMAA